jgi:type VI secretion system VasD/TssJ family lipoprotein
MIGLAEVGLVSVALVIGSGCGWIFGKQQKPMRVEVVFVGSDSLNFDGTKFQPVQVKAYILTREHRFLAADVRAFFNPEFDPGFMSEFEKDMLGSATAIVAPGEKSLPMLIEIPYAKLHDVKPMIGVIANFAQPPRGEHRERMIKGIPKKSKQIACFSLGTDWVEAGKCK